MPSHYENIKGYIERGSQAALQIYIRNNNLTSAEVSEIVSQIQNDLAPVNEPPVPPPNNNPVVNEPENPNVGTNDTSQNLVQDTQDNSSFSLNGETELTLPEELPATGTETETVYVDPVPQSMYDMYDELDTNADHNNSGNDTIHDEIIPEYGDLQDGNNYNITPIEGHIEPDFSSSLEYGQGSLNTELPDEMSNEQLYGLMSNWAYDPNANQNLPLGWNFLSNSGEASGYSHSVFINGTSNQIVIAHAGSNDVSDWLGNGNISSALFDTAHKQISDAMNVHDLIASDYHGYAITHVGHSLGGYLAEVVAFEQTVNAYTFDPLYAGHITGDYSGIIRTGDSGLLTPGVYQLTKSIHTIGLKKTLLKYNITLSFLMNNHDLGNILKDMGIQEDKIYSVLENPLVTDEIEMNVAELQRILS